MNRRNRNFHSKEQVARLAKLIENQGFRIPIIVSSLSGQIISGHGRVMAAKKLGMKEVPVIVQDFKDTDQETSFGISDNSIASWAVLDFKGINEDLADFDPSFDLENLGIKDFTLDAFERDDQHSEEDTKTKTMKFIECPNCKEEFELKQGKRRNA